LDRHYLAVHQPVNGEKASYTVHQAMTDYWTLHGSTRVSADAIRARLKLITRFIDHEIAQRLMREPVLPSVLDSEWLARFRHWAINVDPIAQPRRNPGTGGNTSPSTRKRSRSTAEESIIQLKAALRFNERRLLEVPRLKHLTRAEVTPKRTYRLSSDALGEVLHYACVGDGTAIHATRLMPLRRYLIGAISTLARPDAVMDMSALPIRGQWAPSDRLFDLNPPGRIQTKKYRAIVPVTDLLNDWLSATDDRLVCTEVIRTDEEGEWLDQRPVQSVKKAWQAMRSELGIPVGWGPKLIRYSMASILRRRGVDKDQLAVALGHQALNATTERYATLDPEDPRYLESVRALLEELIADLLQKATVPLRAKRTQVGANGRRRLW
jgi:integrase